MVGDHLQSSLNRFIANRRARLLARAMKMHGLLAMAACDRKMPGFENKAIRASIGMSPGMVEHYTRHIGKEALARQVPDGLERPSSGITKSASQMIAKLHS